MHNKCQTRIQKHIQLVHQQKDEINKKSIIFSNYFLNCTKRNKKIFIAGNGGSASDAQHLNTELQIRYKKKKKAFSLNSAHSRYGPYHGLLKRSFFRSNLF